MDPREAVQAADSAFRTALFVICLSDADPRGRFAEACVALLNVLPAGSAPTSVARELEALLVAVNADGGPSKDLRERVHVWAYNLTDSEVEKWFQTLLSAFKRNTLLGH